MAKASTKGNYPPRPIPPADTYQARNYLIADLGTQKETFKGEEKLVRQIIFGFELIGTKAVFDQNKGEQPFAVSKTFTLSLGEKANLRKFTQSWTGKQVDEFPQDSEGEVDIIEYLKGKPCMITIMHKQNKDKSRTFAEISAITPPMAALGKVPPSVNPLVVFDIDKPETHGNLEKLPKFIQDKILQSPEWNSANQLDDGGIPHPDDRADEF